MTTKTGYKEMLRDRVPFVVDLALKWCKSKTKWVDHVYLHFVNIYKEKSLRYEATRITLGISKYEKKFDFNKSIDWDNISEQDRAYWKNIESWVTWFRNVYVYIESYYRSYTSVNVFKETVKKKYLNTLNEEYQERLCNYLIKSFQIKD